MGDQFEDDLKEMRETGLIYQQIAEQFGDKIELIYADPRNTIAIIDYMFRQLRKGRIGFFTFCSHLFVGSRRGAIFLNGKWLNKSSSSEEKMIHNIQEELGVKS